MNASDNDIIILEYLDGTLTPSARHAFENELNSNPLLKKRFEELKQMHVLMRSGITEQPSKNFTKLVMENLSGRPFYQQLSILNGLMLLIGIITVTGLCAFFVSNGFFDGSTTVDVNSLTPVSDYIEKYANKSIPALNISGKFMVNSIIILNLAVAFVILDRAILKPYFQKRMKTGF
jgi:hypothetical protein